jgi:transcriptional regulator of PTS gene
VIVDGQTGHLDKIKQANAGMIYQLIDMYGPISRIELSKKAQLVPASITKLVRELIDGHLVMENEFHEAGSRGRPAVALMLDTAAWHYLAIRINHDGLILALHDLSARIISEDSIPLPLKKQPLLATLSHEIQQFFQRNHQKLERLTAIAVTLPGVISAKLGIVHSMPFYDITEMPLADILREMTGLPVFVQQDVSAWTMAEYLFGAGKGCDNLLQIVIDHQVSAGVINEGRLLHAGTKRLVELGHCKVVESGRLCYCGNDGCLETVASIEGILAVAAQRAQDRPDSLLHHIPLTIDNFCQAINEGDPLAQEVLSEIGQALGNVVALMVNMFGPEKILIGSPLNQVADILYPILHECIERRALSHYSGGLEILPCRFLNSGTMPAASLIKEALYNGSLLSKLLQG